MKLVFLRHATRSPQSPGDASLNVLGKVQAENLTRLLKPQGPLPPPTQLLASPKRRAQETLTPLSLLTQIPLLKEDVLDERKHGETLTSFESRVKGFLQNLNILADSTPETSPCLYICSHLDWLETAMVLLDSDLNGHDLSFSWATCEFRVFRRHDGIWSLIGSGQSPDRSIESR